MSEMIERVARRICAFEYEGGHLGGAEIEACVDEDMKTSRAKYFRGMAKAAIEASGLLAILEECKRVAQSGESDIRGLPWDKIDAALK